MAETAPSIIEPPERDRSLKHVGLYRCSQIRPVDIIPQFTYGSLGDLGAYSETASIRSTSSGLSASTRSLGASTNSMASAMLGTYVLNAREQVEDLFFCRAGERVKQQRILAHHLVNLQPDFCTDRTHPIISG